MSSDVVGFDPVIIALDFASAAEADALVTALGASAHFYKVGLELFTAAGMGYVKKLVESGKRVFLDLKYYDIGETVKRAVAVVATSGVDFLTIHAEPQVVAAAVEGRGSHSLQLLAVTVLTSFDQSDIDADGYQMPLPDLVALRVKNALAAGADGLIASALDAAAIRRHVGDYPLIVTPGVRSPGETARDQKRVATPAEAIQDGANYIVVGRQVTRNMHPAAALAQIRQELAQVAA